MTYKNAKTILFASLLVAMILPFSGMNFAHATTIEQINTKIQNSMSNIDTVREKLEHTTFGDQKDRLEQTLDKLQTKLDAQIRELVDLSDPVFKQNQIDAEIRTAEKIKKHNDLYESNVDFTLAVDNVKKIISDSTYVDDDDKWNTVLSDLQSIVSIKNGDNSITSTISSDDSEGLRDLIRNELNRQQVSETIKQKSELSFDNRVTTSSIACDNLTDDATPVLFQPTFDYDSPASNAITHVYTVMYEGASIDSSLAGKCVLEVNLVYNDEDHPNLVIDEIYDIVRLLDWGRIADIETMYVVADEITGVGERMSFVEMTLYETNGGIKNLGAIYDGDDSSWDLEKHEIRHVYPVYFYTGNPVVFVNTWNHALGEVPNTTSFPAYAFQLDLYANTNSRPGVENIHSTNSYEPWYGIDPLP